MFRFIFFFSTLLGEESFSLMYKARKTKPYYYAKNNNIN
jgi:hypothetical protein